MNRVNGRECGVLEFYYVVFPGEILVVFAGFTSVEKYDDYNNNNNNNHNNNDNGYLIS